MTKRLMWMLILLVGMASICVLAQEAQMQLPQETMVRLGFGETNDARYSPNGEYLAVGTSIGIELRDAKTLKLLRFFQGHTGSVSSVAFFQNGVTLAS